MILRIYLLLIQTHYLKKRRHESIMIQCKKYKVCMSDDEQKISDIPGHALEIVRGSLQLRSCLTAREVTDS